MALTKVRGSGLDSSQEGAITFNEGSADVDFRVESNGNTHALFVDAGNDHVNINTSSDLGSTLNINGEVTIANADSGLLLVENAADAFGSNFTMRKSRNTTLNGHTVVQSGDVTGNINFQGSDGDEFLSTASIASAVDATPGNNDMPGRLVFSTTNGGASSPTERARITRGGTFLVGSTTGTINSSNFGFRVDADGFTTLGKSASSTSSVAEIYGANGHFKIMGDGDAENSSGRYSSISDERYKENIVDANSQWDDIKAIKVRNYNFKEEKQWGTHKQIGVIAQELEASGMTGGLVRTNDDGYKSVATSILYMKAVKALQEAMTRIETLEAKVKTLESK